MNMAWLKSARQRRQERDEALRRWWDEVEASLAARRAARTARSNASKAGHMARAKMADPLMQRGGA